MTYRIQLKNGWRIDKHGKLVKSNKHLNVSLRLKQASSKRIRAVPKGKIIA